MIIKEAAESVKIKKLKLMFKRSPLDLPSRKDIESELARSLAGYRGEKSMEYHLNLLPKDDCYIFHDLRLPYDSHFFQLDILILTSAFFLIIEVKNIAGTLIFDQEFKQLHRIFNGIEDTFPDPISQLYRQTFLLKEWLNRQRFPSIPIESLVIISNPNTSIKAIPPQTNLAKHVTHSSDLLARFHTYQKLYKEEVISKKEIKKLSRLLIKQHNPGSPDLFSQFSIDKNDLIKGIACLKCESLPMVRMKGTWLCLQCGNSCKKAHIEALKDYALLIKPTITTCECSEFLQIPSQDMAKHLLNALNLTTSKIGRKNVYHLNELM